MKLHNPLFQWFLALLVSSQLNIVSSQSCPAPIVIKGKKFFNSQTGEYFPVKGINYYPRPNAGELGEGGSRDYFTEEMRPIWERDIEQFKALGVNAIRLYAVDPSENHDAFMCALQEAGIYVIVGLSASCEDCAITKDEAPACYPAALKDRGQYIINVFSKYTNVLAFSAGNEINLVAPAGEPEGNAACKKQFIRDMRAYISGCGPDVMRQIPVGLVTADIEREENAMYYGCQTVPGDDLEVTEWYGINTYVHCDGSATDISQLTGYQMLLNDFGTYGLSYPVMLTEFGCLNPSFPTLINDDGMSFDAQRTWLQVEAIFDPQYEVEFNGGFVFEYSTEKVYSESLNSDTSSPWPFDTYGPGNYGVGYFDPIDCDDIDIPCTYIPFPQFDLLAAEYAAADASAGRPTMDSYTPGAATTPACPEGFPALSDFTWPSASQEDRVCWDDGGFKCPICGGGPLTNVPASSETTSPAPATPPPATETSSQPSVAMDTTMPTDPFTPTATTREPTTSAPVTTPEPSEPVTTPEPSAPEPTAKATPSPTVDLSNLPDSFLGGATSGAHKLSRTIALRCTILALTGFHFYG
jgi:hypothetical protein